MLTTPTKLSERFREGVYLTSSGEFDEAHDILTDCVIERPDNLDFVDGLLDNLTQKCGVANGDSSSNGDLPADLKRACAQKNWAELRREALRQLASNPWHVATLRALAEASATEGAYDVELRYLEMAREAAPRDVALHRHCGQSFARARQFEEALACWRRVEELDPDDSEAARAISVLTIEHNRTLAGLASDVNSPAVANRRRRAHGSTMNPPIKIRFDEGIANREVLRQSPEVRRTPIQQLELAIREYPSQAEYYLQLAPLYLAGGRDYDAERLLTKALEFTDDDPRIRHIWEDVTMLRLELKVTLARQQAEVDTTETAQEALAEACSKRDRMETEIFVERCKREPDNAAMKYELGLRLKQARRLREAYQRFEEALVDPDQKCFAALEMGECRREFQEFPEAFRYYRLAAESVNSPDQWECKKQALYQAGTLAREIKMYSLAQRYLAELLSLDAKYKDAVTVMHDLQRHL